MKSVTLSISFGLFCLFITRCYCESIAEESVSPLDSMMPPNCEEVQPEIVCYGGVAAEYGTEWLETLEHGCTQRTKCECMVKGCVCVGADIPEVPEPGKPLCNGDVFSGVLHRSGSTTYDCMSAGDDDAEKAALMNARCEFDADDFGYSS